MKNRSLAPALGLLAATLFGSCSEPNITYVEPVKMYDSDPFKNEMVESQLIEIDGSADNTVEGKNGTVVVLPKGCFRRKDGSEVTGKIQLELAEALNPGDMLTSNLTTASNGQPLETGGMIYMNAKADGEQLGVANDNPLYVYIPTDQKKAGMQVYTGTRDKNGNMNWVNPQPLRELLATLPLNELDFLPDGYAEAVKSGMPFRGRKKATRALVDSLYFFYDGFYQPIADEFYRKTMPELYNITEPMYAQKKGGVELQEAKADTTISSYKPRYSDAWDTCGATGLDGGTCCYLDPKDVYTLTDKKFSNTFIATKAFEKRIKVLHRICGRKLMRLYIDNLEKDLWQVDSMVADRLKGEPGKESIFRTFAAEKLTNVKGADKTAQLLKGYFDKKRKANQEKEAELKKKMTAEFETKSAQLDKTIETYKEVLYDRETYRMEGYGFQRTELGWVNVDIGTEPKKWFQQILNCTVTNGNDFERVYCYLFIEDLKSLHKFYARGKTQFNTGGDSLQYIPLPKNGVVSIIAVGYNGKRMYMGLEHWTSLRANNITVELRETTKEKFTELMTRRNPVVEKSNNIILDLAYQDTFYQAMQERKSLEQDYYFLENLQRIAQRCCQYCNPELIAVGEQIFNAKCISCHSAGSENSTGPGLAGLRNRIPAGDWAYRFITNPAGMLASGDAYAVALKAKYPTVMTAQNLTREEVDAVLDWLDCQGGLGGVPPAGSK